MMSEKTQQMKQYSIQMTKVAIEIETQSIQFHLIPKVFPNSPYPVDITASDLESQVT